ncbi:hypothetical protein D9M68_894490 [compost metagenome]
MCGQGGEYGHGRDRCWLALGLLRNGLIISDNDGALASRCRGHVRGMRSSINEKFYHCFLDGTAVVRLRAGCAKGWGADCL